MINIFFSIISFVGAIMFYFDGSMVMFLFLTSATILFTSLFLFSKESDKNKDLKTKPIKSGDTNFIDRTYIIEDSDKGIDSQTKTTLTEKNTIEIEKQKKPEKVISTTIVGMSYKNPDGTSRQKIFKEYFYDSAYGDLYDGLKNRDILYSTFDCVFEYELCEFNDIELIKEPDNEFDKNAIQVKIIGYGVIGYIPKKDSFLISSLLETNSKYSTTLESEGGKFKYYDENSDSVKIKTVPYKLNLTITFYSDKESL